MNIGLWFVSLPTSIRFGKLMLTLDFLKKGENPRVDGSKRGSPRNIGDVMPSCGGRKINLSLLSTTYLPIYLSIYLPIYLSICVIYLSIYILKVVRATPTCMPTNNTLFTQWKPTWSPSKLKSVLVYLLVKALCSQH